MNAKIVIILGSPRKKGNSATLADKVAESAIFAGAEVEKIYLNGLDIRPCQGCEKCQDESYSGCVLKDDMTSVHSKIHAADSIVIASPIYWFDFSAQTKIFIDRLYAVAVGNKNILKGKNTAVLLSYADSDPFTSGAVNALRSFQDICRYLGANIEGMVYGSAYGPGEIEENQGVMEQASQLGKHLASIRMKQV